MIMIVKLKSLSIDLTIDVESNDWEGSFFARTQKLFESFLNFTAYFNEVELSSKSKAI